MLVFNTCTISMGCYAHIQHMLQLCYELLSITDVFNPRGAVMLSLLVSYIKRSVTLVRYPVTYLWGLLCSRYCVILQTVCYPSAVSCDLSVWAVMLAVLCHTPNNLLP